MTDPVLSASDDPMESATPDNVRIAAFYCFVPLPDPAAVRVNLLDLCREGGIKGTIIVAGEGYNGTVAGPGEAIERLVAALLRLAGPERAEIKYADAPALPFRSLRVRLKPEIVTMRQPGLDVAGSKGAYVEPQQWNALLEDPATLLVDTRNSYEHRIGSFTGALDPETVGFTEFPAWLAGLADGLSEQEKRERPLAMFCTGGVRCEKSTAYARSLGFEQVYHLKGGILAYLEQVPEPESRWQGDCFVFDDRVAVTHGLAPGSHGLCKACGMPVALADMEAHVLGCRKG